MRLPLSVTRAGLFTLALLLLTGCDPILRTYGGHGTVEAYHAQLQVAVDGFEASLARNRADLTRLSQEATGNPAVRDAAEAMARIVTEQELMATVHRARLDDLLEENDYRKLHNAYGAFTVEHQIMADRYSALVDGLVQDTTGYSYIESAVERSRYVVVPPQYYRVNNRVRTPALNTIPVPSATPAIAAPAPDTAAVADTAAVR